MNHAKIDTMKGSITAEFNGGTVTLFLEDEHGEILSVAVSDHDAEAWARQILGVLKVASESNPFGGIQWTMTP